MLFASCASVGSWYSHLSRGHIDLGRDRLGGGGWGDGGGSFLMEVDDEDTGLTSLTAKIHFEVEGITSPLNPQANEEGYLWV